VKEKRESK